MASDDHFPNLMPLLTAVAPRIIDFATEMPNPFISTYERLGEVGENSLKPKGPRVRPHPKCNLSYRITDDEVRVPYFDCFGTVEDQVKEIEWDIIKTLLNQARYFIDQSFTNNARMLLLHPQLSVRIRSMLFRSL
jgi:hypothetical protein